MKITFETAYSILEGANAISLEINGCHPVLEPSLIDGDEEIFMRFEWENEGQIWEFKFPLEGNEEVELNASILYLKDENGDEYQITVLRPWDVEAEIQEEQDAEQIALDDENGIIRID